MVIKFIIFYIYFLYNYNYFKLNLINYIESEILRISKKNENRMTKNIRMYHSKYINVY